MILAVLLRGESLLPAQAAGAVLATAGVVLAGRRVRRVARCAARGWSGPGSLIAVVTMLLFAVITVALAAPIQDHGWLPVVLGSRLANTASAVLLLVVGAARRSDGGSRC